MGLVRLVWSCNPTHAQPKCRRRLPRVSVISWVSHISPAVVTMHRRSSGGDPSSPIYSLCVSFLPVSPQILNLFRFFVIGFMDIYRFFFSVLFDWEDGCAGFQGLDSGGMMSIWLISGDRESSYWAKNWGLRVEGSLLFCCCCCCVWCVRVCVMLRLLLYR